MPPSRLPSALAPLIVAGTLLAVPAASEACSCADMPGPEFDGLPGYEAVFRGTVVAVEVPWLLRDLDDIGPVRGRLLDWTEPEVRAVMRVDEAWRGVETRELELELGTGLCCGCSLGTNFGEVGDELIVFAYERDDGALATSLCSHPIPVAEGQQALEAFGPGVTALKPGRKGRRRPWLLPGFAGLFVIGLGLVMIGRRRARQSSAPEP